MASILSTLRNAFAPISGARRVTVALISVLIAVVAVTILATLGIRPFLTIAIAATVVVVVIKHWSAQLIEYALIIVLIAIVAVTILTTLFGGQ